MIFFCSFSRSSAFFLIILTLFFSFHTLSPLLHLHHYVPSVSDFLLLLSPHVVLLFLFPLRSVSHSFLIFSFGLLLCQAPFSSKAGDECNGVLLDSVGDVLQPRNQWIKEVCRLSYVLIKLLATDYRKNQASVARHGSEVVARVPIEQPRNYWSPPITWPCVSHALERCVLCNEVESLFWCF